MYNVFEKSKLFSKLQFGFRKGHGSDHPMVIINQLVSDCLDKGEIPTILFHDIQKALNSISHFFFIF